MGAPMTLRGPKGFIFSSAQGRTRYCPRDDIGQSALSRARFLVLRPILQWLLWCNENKWAYGGNGRQGEERCSVDRT